MNAVLSGVKDIRAAIAGAQARLERASQRTILFVDEVHRFNKAQQDALLPHVENGTVVFVGATTENPYFEVIKALVSRSRVFELKTLSEDDLRQVAHRTLADEERGYGGRDVRVDGDAPRPPRLDGQRRRPLAPERARARRRDDGAGCPRRRPRHPRRR